MKIKYKISFVIFITILLPCKSFNAFAQCPNLVINGDFDDASCPPVSFQSTLVCTRAYPGSYSINKDAGVQNGDWHGQDHTDPGQGNFFIGDGPSNVATDAKIWYQSVPVTAGTEYTFSAWVANIDVTNYTPDPMLNLSIGGVVVATSGRIPEYTYWRQMVAVWTAPADMTIEVAVVITGGNYGGNDFGVDDISLTANNSAGPPPIASDVSRCGPGSVTLNASGGTSYRWYDSVFGTVPVNTNSSYSITALDDTTTYYVSEINNGSCESTRTPVHAIVNPIPQPDLGSDQSICEDSSYIFDSGPGYANYYWNGDSSDSTDRYFEATKKGKYWVTVKNKYGCENADTVAIIGLYPLPVAKAGEDENICEGAKGILTATGGDRYVWMPGGETTASIVVAPQITSSYSVVAYDTVHECKPSSDNVTVFVHPLPTESPFGNNTLSHCFEEDAILVGGQWGTKFLWNPGGDTTQYITVPQEGIYSLTVSDQYGCSITEKITIKNECPPTIYVPSAFSPNQDGLNDELEIFGKYLKEFELMIFNRWGEIIFISKDWKYKWDGIYRGEEMPIGAYPWLIKYGNDAGLKTLKGSVTLIR